jgi:putative tryptophan/tyrosine transport system substrate-binding protein
MKRRQFITLVGSAAAAWPLAVRAQQPSGMRRIGVLMALPPDDTEGQERIAAFAQALQQLGWTIGQNIRINYRWAAGDGHDMSRYAAEFVASDPDVILAHSSAAVAPLMQLTRTIPIVFTIVADPVALATSIAWRAQAVMPPALPALNTPSPASGLNY